MTLPSIGATLERTGLNPATLDAAAAKVLVYDAIRTDLAPGVAWLHSLIKSYSWRNIREQHEVCVHCEIKDLEVRKQVIRLAAYTGLRAFVQEELGALVALHNFRPTSGANNDEGPSARLIIEPVQREDQLRKGHFTPGVLKTSPEQSWQVIGWGPTLMPPALLSRAEAEEKIWDWAELNCSRGLAFLRQVVRQGLTAEDVASNAPGELLPEMVQLLGVPGVQSVVAQQLGVTSFHFYNCCKGVPAHGAFSWQAQLLNQANEAMLDC